MKLINKIFGAKYCPEKLIHNILFALVVLLLISAVFPSRLKNEEGNIVKESELVEYEVGGRVATDIYMPGKKGRSSLILKSIAVLPRLKARMIPPKERIRARDIIGTMLSLTENTIPISASRLYLRFTRRYTL